MKLARLGDGPEIFHTLQGEGISVGMAAVFIRASRCNLHCVWCDTDHTWNFRGTPWPHEKDAVPGYSKYVKAEVTWEISAEEVAERVLSYCCDRSVITGGEPLLQEAEFLQVIGKIRDAQPDHEFEVETNGTRMPSPAFVEAVNQFNVSPKLSNAGLPETLRVNAEVLKFFGRCSKAWFKFVVANPSEMMEIETLCRDYEIPRSRVMLMPEGRTSAELDLHAGWLADICRDQGFRFCDRLHIRLWGDVRGV